MATARPGEDGYQDGYEETKAKIEYLKRLEREGKSLPPKPEDDPKFRICRSCGQTGRVGAYPFSTIYSPNRYCLCDDCV